MPTQHTCAHGKCTNEVALSSRYCPEHGSAQIRFLYHLLDNRIRHCVQWPFTRLKTGYGVINTKFTEQASRYACAILHGLPPANFLVGAHNCGNGHEGCVNPYHLRWATAQENAIDRVIHALQREKYGKTASNRFGPLLMDGIERRVPKKKHPVKRIELVREIGLARISPKPAQITAVIKDRDKLARMYLSKHNGQPLPLAIVDPDLYARRQMVFTHAEL